MIPNIVKVGSGEDPTTLEFVTPWVAFTLVAGSGGKAILCCRRSQ